LNILLQTSSIETWFWNGISCTLQRLSFVLVSETLSESSDER